MYLQKILTPHIVNAIKEIYNIDFDKAEFQATKKDFEGDITFVIFPLLKLIKGNPVEIGNKIGEYLVKNASEVEKFNVIAGFLNIVISDNYYISFFKEINTNSNFGIVSEDTNKKAIMVEYSSPNTNKPLHLGHVRNNLLGYSVAEILKASGRKVYKTQIINDRGIHICKSMLAWQKFGNGETPQSSGLKGDHFVGKYYILYNNKYQEEYNQLQSWAEQAYRTLSEPDEKINSNIKEFKRYVKQEQTVTVNDNIIWALGGLALSIYLYKKESSSEETKNLAVAGGIVSTLLALNSIEFNTIYKEEYIPIQKTFLEKNKNNLDKFKNKTEREIINELMAENKDKYPLLQEAQQMLLDWEAGKPEVIELWKTMNQWVYDGFAQTYKNLGVDFDSYYYESNTYLLGKEVVQFGLEKGIFEKDPDGSVWIDLTPDGLDRKIVLRSDGTAVYMTQDIGTAIQRVKDYPDVGGMVYTVGNEQDYHFKVLFLILKKLGFDWAENLYHLSYGMVELPSGKMKSREGTVVDADDLMTEMTTTAKTISEELGKLEGYSNEEKEKLYKTIGLGALKYYLC
jgi:arginyl-tRNA synthetase